MMKMRVVWYNNKMYPADQAAAMKRAAAAAKLMAAQTKAFNRWQAWDDYAKQQNHHAK